MRFDIANTFVIGLVSYFCISSNLVHAAESLSELDDATAIASALDNMVDDKMLVGAAVGIYNKGEVEFIYAGHRTLHRAYPVGADTRFEIGSITKTFTGILLADAQLNQALALETPITTLLPDNLQREALKNITLRQLSTHSSGLPRLPSNLTPSDSGDPYADYDTEKLHTFLSDFNDFKATDDEVVYSNLAIGLLGHLLAVNADMTYPDLLAARILQPLSMSQTYISTPDSRLEELALPHANDLHAVKPWRFDAIAPAGGISSTLPDMMRYLKVNIDAHNDALSSQKDALSKAISLSQQAKYPFNDEMQMGLGWIEQATPNGKIIWHNGGTAGSSSFLGFNPNTQQGIVILMNVSGQATEAGFAFLNGEVQAYLSRFLSKNEADISDEHLKKLVGKYALAPNFILHVTQAGNQLFVQATGQGKIEVFPKSKTRFYYKVVDAEIEFTLNDKGEAIRLTLFQNGREMPGDKQD